MKWHGGKHQAKEKGVAPRDRAGDGGGANLHTVFSKKLIGKMTFERNFFKKCEFN